MIKDISEINIGDMISWRSGLVNYGIKYGIVISKDTKDIIVGYEYEDHIMNKFRAFALGYGLTELWVPDKYMEIVSKNNT